MSPAVCGLFRPVILLPRALTEKLATAQLRAVLLHEMIHLKRRDVWVNCAQALIQIVYWWHPLLWFANARIRRVREEAVDDAVMLALRDDSETYAPTLLEVAKLALNRPLASLGLVGILESRNALRQRIERLIHFPAPRKAGLSVMSLMGLAAFTAVALPMGQAPEKSGEPVFIHSQQPVASLVQDGKVLYEAGKLNEARAKFESALSIDPKNPAALYYLSLVTNFLEKNGNRNTVRPAHNLPLIENSNGNNARAMIKVAQTSSSSEVSTNIIMRTFSVDRNTFVQNLKRIGVLKSGDGLSGNPAVDRETVQNGILKWFSSMGIHVQNLNWNSSNGNLLVRAPRDDIDTIESAIGSVYQSPPQVNVKAVFIQVSKDLLATLQSFPSMTNSEDDQIRILMMTPVQARSIMKALKSSSKNNLLAVGEVTTLSARQAEIQIEGTQAFPTNVYHSADVKLPKTYSTGTDVLDVFPVVADDGRTIQLRLAISAVEFLGLADPGPFKIGDSSEIHYQNPIPRYRIHEMKANVTVRDGQTVVLFDNSAKISGSNKPYSSNKQILVFVTPTLIDAAGNRIHSDAQ
jgi:hypothetical protein